jgi:hypothetical protein
MEPTEIYDHPDIELIPNGIDLSAGAAGRPQSEIEPIINVRFGSWLRKNVSERSKAASDWLASTLKRADWLFLRSRGLETLLKLPEVILSDLETPRQPAAQARIAARSGFTPTMFITRVRL